MNKFLIILAFLVVSFGASAENGRTVKVKTSDGVIVTETSRFVGADKFGRIVEMEGCVTIKSGTYCDEHMVFEPATKLAKK